MSLFVDLRHLRYVTPSMIDCRINLEQQVWSPTKLRVATYKRIRAVQMKIPDHVSAEAADLIKKVCFPFTLLNIVTQT